MDIMMSVIGRSRFTRSFTPLGQVVAPFLVVVVVVGCNKSESNTERMKAAYENAGMKPTSVYPLSGTLTVDNQAPVGPKSRRWAIAVMAYDTSKPDQPARGQAFVMAKSDGSFTFGEGLPPGKYVMLFAGLEFNKRRGWHGPDLLKNLYNDPDVNAKKTEFLIEVPPAKTDCAFNLSVVGEAPLAKPGPKSLIDIPN
jgi:hypothetical protein